MAAYSGQKICGATNCLFENAFRNVRLAVLGLVLVGIAGCVSGSPLPPRDLATVLSPTQLENQNLEEAAKSAENTAAAVSETPATENAPSTKSAITTTKKDSKATQAAESTVKPAAETKTATAEPKTAAVVTKPSFEKTAAVEAKKPTAPKKDETTPKISTPAVAVAVPSPPPVKKKSFLASLFQSNNADTITHKANKRPRKTKKAPVKRPRAKVSSRSGSLNALPGVRTKGLFGIIRSSKKRDPNLDEPVEVASISNLARRGNFGLLLQTKNVKVGCFPRRLVRLLKQVERRYGRTPIVTSGYRSRAKNRRIRGARNSTHIRCHAADIQVKGVSKWKLAKYLRSLPGRGGVGTYCHTKSVHIDIGKKRNWNWRCRRKRKRKS